MKSSTLIAMTAIVLVAISTLLILNFAPKTYISTPPMKSTFPSNDISGVAVVHKGIPYTLNFDQQKGALDAINRAVEVKKADYPGAQASFDFDKIILYRFNAPDVELIPVQFVDRNLVFSVPALSKNEYFLELSGGELQDMINTSFDK